MSHNIWTRWVSRLFQQKVRTRIRKQRQRLGLESLEERVVPTTDVWQGTTAKWSTAANWSAGVPKAGYDLVFNSTTAFKATTDDVALAAGTAFNSITFSAGGYSISGAAGSKLVVSGAFTVGANLGTETITANTELLPAVASPKQTFAINVGSTLDVSGQLSGNPVAANAANQTLNKTLTGTLQLDGNNTTWTGAVTAAAGIIAITNANALGTGAAVAGTSAGITTVASNAQLQVSGGLNPINENLILNGPGINADGALLNVSGINLWAGTVALAAGPSPVFLGSNAGNLYMQGQISDQGAAQSLTKVGAGTITFSHLGGDTYRGQTSVNNGILAIQDPLSLGAGADFTKPQSGTPASETIVNYNHVNPDVSGTLELDYNPGPVTAANPSPTPIPTSDPNAIVVNGVVTGFQVFNDILVLNGPGGPNNAAAGARLGSLYNLAGENGWDGSVVLGSITSSVSDVYIGAAANTDLTISGVVSEPQAFWANSILHKVQPGRVILNDANTYVGGTEVDAGELQIRDSSALGTGAVTVQSGASLEMAVDSGLDGTALRTHNRNLGFDSITNSGQGLIPATSPPIIVNPPDAGDFGAGESYDQNTGHFLGFDGTNTEAAADSFTVSSNVTLQTLSMALGEFGAGPNNGVTVTIHSGSPTGALIDTFDYDTADGTTIHPFGASGNSPLTLYSTTFPTLTVGITYWIVAQANTPATDFYGWNFNNGGLIQDHGFSLDGGATWDTTIPDTVGAFAINNVFPPIAGSVQEVYVPGSSTTTGSGTFTLTFEGQTTGSLAYNVSAANLQSDLNALATVAAVGGVVVTQDADVYRVAFGNPTSTDIPLMTITPTASIANSVVNPVYGLTVTNPLTISGTGVGGEGALDSISGINQYVVPTITIGAPGSIGVSLDTRSGHTTADNSYSIYDYRLTIPNTDELNSGGNTFIKEGKGQLVLPSANDTLTGPTIINAGWITVENNDSLGSPLPNPAVIYLLQPDPITVKSGASLQLLAPTGTNLTIGNNLILAGPGLPSHNFNMLTEGAVLSLAGENELTGTIQLNGTVGIGVDDPITSDLFSLSTLTTTGQISDGASSGGITKLGSRGLTIQGPGIYTGANTLKSGTLLVQNDTALGQATSGTAAPRNETYTNTATTVNTGGLLELGNGAPTDNGGVASGVQIWNEQLVLKGQGQQIAVYGAAGQFTLTFNSATTGALAYNVPASGGVGPLASIQNALNALATIGGVGGSVTVTQAGSVYTVLFGGTLAGANNPLLVATAILTPTGPNDESVTVSGSNFPIDALDDNLWTGPVTLAANTTLEAAANARLTLDGTIDDATNPAKSGSTLTVNQIGTLDTGELVLAGTNTYRGTTYVQQGVLTVANSQALGGIGGSEVQTITVAGISGTFTVNFNGYTTGPLPFNVTAANLATALDALTSVGGVGGSVTVTQAGNVYTVTFGGGSLFGAAQPLMVAAGTAITTPNSVVETQQGYGGTAIASGAQMQLEGNLTVAGETLTLTGKGVGTTPTNVPLRWFAAGPAPINNGQTPGTPSAISGRVTGVATDPTDPNVIYVSSAGGGAWKTINDGLTWTPLFDGVPEIQTLTVGSGTGNFTLKFNGSAASATINGNSQTLALDVQNALDGLSTIGGVGGSVVVTQAGNVLTVTFVGGTLVGNLPAILPSVGSVTQATIAIGQGANVALFAGAITADPTTTGTVYLGTGEANNSGDAYYGTGVYLTKDYGKSWNLITNPNGSNPLYGAAISQIVLDPNNPGTFYVAASDQATNSGTPGNAGIWRWEPASGVKPGWTNLTNITSDLRANGVANPDIAIEGDENITGGPQPPINGITDPLTATGFPGAPGTPGPDDNFNLFFTTSDVYSGVQLGWTTVQTLQFNGTQWAVTTVQESALFASLGTPGDPNGSNAVYRLNAPAQATDPTNTVWDIGDGNVWTIGNPSGTPPMQTLTVTYAAGGSGTFPTGSNDTIKIASDGGFSGGAISTIYAGVTDTFTGGQLGVYESTDGGLTWAAIAAPTEYLFAQGNYDNSIYLDTNYNLYVGGTSQNGDTEVEYFNGAWNPIATDFNGNGPYTNVHAMTVDSNGQLLVGTDGGIFRDDVFGTGLWSNLNGNLAIAQLNGAATAPGDPQDILSTSQDNSINLNGPGTQAWTQVLAGSELPSGSTLPYGNGQVTFNTQDPTIAYAVSNGSLLESTDGGNTWNPILGGIAAANGYAPVATDVVNPSRLLVGGSILQESLDGGATWTDLGATLGTPLNGVTAIAAATYQGESGPNGTFVTDPLFSANLDTGANTYDPEAIYVTDGTHVKVTLNHGISWADRSPGGLGVGQIHGLVVDPRNRNDVYAVVQAPPGSAKNEILYSTNAGQTWKNIANNLPHIPFWTMAIDARSGTLYLGTDQGVYSAVLNAANPTSTVWSQFGRGLPVVQVTGLQLDSSTNTLTAATYGRGAYQFDLNSVAANTGALRVLSGSSTWTGSVLINGPTTIQADGTQSDQVSSQAIGILPLGIAQLDVTGIIADVNPANASTDTLTKTGLGTFVFSGANTYGGVTTIQNGVVIANNLYAMGGGGAAMSGPINPGTTVVAGAALELEANLDNVPVTLNGDGISFNSHNTGALRNISGDNTFAGNIALGTGFGSNKTVTVGADSGSTMTLTGVISGGSSGFTFIGEGTGTVVLAGANTYTSPTDVYQGSLQLQNNTALGPVTNVATVLDGAQMQIQSTAAGASVTVGNPLAISGTGIFGTGALLDTGGSNTWAGPITFTTLPGFSPTTTPVGTVSIGVTNAPDTLTIGNVISQAPAAITSSLQKVGAGNLALQGKNSYDGTTEVAAGTLTVQNASALGKRPADFANLSTVEQIFAFDPADPVPTVGTTAVSASLTLNFDGKTTKVAWGKSGPTGAAVQAKMVGLFASAGLVGATVAVTKIDVDTTTQNTPPSLVAAGSLYTLVFGGTLANTSLPVTATGYNGVIAAGSVVAVGGIDTQVDTGATLALDSSQSITPLGFNVDPHWLVLNGSGAVTAAEPNGEGALYNAVGNNTWTGENAQRITITAPTGVGKFAVTYNGKTTGFLPFNVAASGGVGPTASLQNALNALSSIGGVGGTATVTLTGNVYTVTFGGTLTVANTTSMTAQGISGATATVTDAIELASSASIGAAAGTTLTIPVTVGGPTGTEVLTKDSPGTVDVTGTFTRSTVVASGTLQVQGMVGTIGGIVLQDDGTSAAFPATLSGTGTVGIITGASASGGTIDPGNSAAPFGTLNNNGSVSTVGTKDVLNAHDTIYADLDYTTNGHSSLLNVTNASIDLGGASLAGTAAGLVPIGNQFTILKTDAATHPADVITGHFAGLATAPLAGGTSATIGWIGTQKFVVDYFSDHLVITRISANVTIALTDSIGSPTYGQDEIFTATLTPETFAPAVSGVVVFTAIDPSGHTATYTETITTIASGVGVATLDLSVLSPLGQGSAMGVGNWTISVSYDGKESGFQTFIPVPPNPAPPPLSVDVLPSPTTTALVSSVTTATYGQNFTLTATVTSAALAPIVSPTGEITAPNGTVSFYENVSGTSLLLGSALSLPAGNGLSASVTLDTSTLPSLLSGLSNFYAVYNGDGTPLDYTGSTSPPVTVDITQDGTTTNVTAAPSPASYGQPVLLTATVTANGANGGIPNGIVNFYLGSVSPGTLLGSGTLNGSAVATYTTSPFQLGLGSSQLIIAVYLGSQNYLGSQGTTTETVGLGQTTTVVSGMPPTIVYGQQVTFAATVTANAGSGIPTGTVNFYLGTGASQTFLGMGTLNVQTGVAFYTTTSFQIGVGANQTITAKYLGDSNFFPSSGTTMETMTQDGTTEVVVLAPATVVYGQSAKITVTANPNSPGTGIPTGTVDFYVGTGASKTHLGTSTLNALGVATYTTSPLQLGVGSNQTITATYNGDGNFIGNSGTNLETVNQDGTLLGVVGAPATSDYGQTVKFTATVTDQSPGSGTPTGNVKFYLGSASGTLLGTGALNGSGVATYTTSAFQLGVSSPLGSGQTITAVYVGDSNFLTSSNTTSEVVNEDPTSTVVSSLGTVVYGQPATFSATISSSTPGSGTPTGTVNFYLGSALGTFLGSGTLNGSGVATYATTAFQLGVSSPLGSGQTITAVYVSDGNYLGSSGTTSEVVNQDATSTSVTGSLPVVFGQPATFTATVSASAPGAGTPTGTVTFFLGSASGTPLGTGTLNALGVATYTTAAFQLPVGNNETITAVYLGDGNFIGGAANDGTTTQTVTQAQTTTTVTASSTTSPPVYGQPITFTATMTVNGPGSASVSGTSAMTGTVSFYLGSAIPANLLGTGNVGVVGGAFVATYSTSPGSKQVPVGSNQTITAVYSGDTHFVTSTGSTSTVNVAKDSTTPVATSSAPTAFAPQAVTFTAVVNANAPGSGSPTGTVIFFDNGTQLDASPVTLVLVGSQMTATFTTAIGQLPIGLNQTITATYSGDSNFLTGSGTTTQNVIDGTTTTVTASPASPVYGEPVTFTATIAPGQPFSPSPSGIVTFLLGGTTLGTGNVTTTGGVTTATFLAMAGQLPVGTDAIAASYSGDLAYGSSQGTLSQNVSQDSTTPVLSTSATSAAVDGQVTLTTVVKANLPGSGTPTGTVTFTDTTTNTVLGTAVLTGGSASIQTTLPSVAGNYVISATYNGDGNFTKDVSNSITENVTGIATQTLLAVSNVGLIFGQSVTFTGTVTALSGLVPPTGTVSFYDNYGMPSQVLVGSGTLGAPSGPTATATFSTSSLAVGSYAITAIYNADASAAIYGPSQSVAVNMQVFKDNSSTTVTASPASSSFGQPVTFTATVVNLSVSAIPTGTVTFAIGNATLGSGPLITNPVTHVTTASYTTSAFQIPEGASQTVTASYSGDGNVYSSFGTTTESVSAIGSTTSVKTSLSPSLVGQSVTFTATIGSTVLGSPNPSGTVTFTYGPSNVTLGTVPVLTSGGITTASLSTIQMPTGTSVVKATYSGDSNFAASSGTVSQAVGSLSTKTTLTASASSVVANMGVVFTATVAPSAGSGTPTGTVIFTDTTTGANLGTGTLVGGVATIEAALGTSLGGHTIVAAYSSDSTFAASTSLAIAVSVVANGTRTSTVAVASSASPLDVGQSVTFTATVKDSGALPAKTPTGTVAFYANGFLIGYGTLSTTSGKTTATFSTTALNLGTSSITAVYSGSPTFATAKSAAISQVVTTPTRTSNTTLASSASPSTFSQSVTFTATVKDSGSGTAQTPSGTVTFVDVATNTVLGTVNLTTAGTGTATATFKTASLAVGSHNVTAVYNGNVIFAKGNTASFTQVVNKVGSKTTLKSSATSATSGQSVTFTATIAPTLSGVVPTGTVTFYDASGTQILGTVSVTTTGGVTTAVFKTTALAKGTDNVYAVYSGDVDVATSNSNTVIETVS